MTINSVDILFSWYDEDKRCLKELKKRADEGDQECLADFIGIQTELSTNAEEVQTNIELLKKLSDQGNSRANLVLGVLYNEGLCKNSKNTDSEIFIEQDFETSDFYLERAAKENNPVALFMLCTPGSAAISLTKNANHHIRLRLKKILRRELNG